MKARTLPELSTTLRWFLFAMILANIAGEMVFVLLPLYLVQLGAGVVQVGLTFSVAAIVPLLLQILGGWVSDSIGRLRTIAVGALCACLGYLGMAIAPSWQWAMLALCLEFVSGSLVGPSFAAFIAEQTSEESRGRVFGLSRGIFQVVTVIGPLLGGVLAARMGFRAMLWVAFALYAGAAGLRFWMASTVRFAGEAKPVPLTLRSLRSNLGTIMGMLMGGGLLAWILVTDGVRDVSARLSNELQPLYLAQVGGATVAQVGWLRSLMGIAMMLVALPAGWISDRRGERVAIAGGFVLSSVGLVALVQSRGLAGFAAAVLLYGAGIGLVSPAYDSLVSKAVPQRLRGLAYGLFGTSLGLISLPAPWVGARLWEQFGPRVPILITAAASAAAAVPAWFKFVLPPRREDASVSKA